MIVKRNALPFAFVNFVKMIAMKTSLLLFAISIAIYSCGSGNKMNVASLENSKNDTIKIENDSLEYKIIIVENGFNSWLISQPPRGFYGQTKLETSNRQFVTEYNARVLQPNRYSRNLYLQQIDYEPTIDYGYEVNYLLYNYFVFFEQKYNQNLLGGRN